MVGAANDMPSMICHPDRHPFEDTLKGLRSRLARESADAFSLLCDLLMELHRSELGSTELSARVDILIKSCVISPDNQVALATLARALRPELKTVIIAFLPPTLKRHVYNTTASPNPLPPQQAADTIQARIEAVSEEKTAGAKTVFLLGHGQDHETNHSTLIDKEFTPLRVRNLEELDRVLTPDTCGIIVASSWWAMLPGDQHEKLLKRLISHSTFAWLKIDLDGLNADVDARDLCYSILFRHPTTFEMALQSGCSVHRLEIPSLQKASELLSRSADVQMRPAEIDEDKARVLVGATSKHVDGRHLADGSFRMESVATSTIHGGRSNALVVRVDPDDGGPSLVAKFDKLEYLTGEMHRFHRFIAWSNPQVNPTLHFHAGTALIAFHLVDCPENPGSRAPTLEESISKTMSEEVRNVQNVDRIVDDLWAAIDRSIEKLNFLNGKPCSDVETPCWAYLGLDIFESALSGGLTWALTDFDGHEIELDAMRRRAQGLVEARKRAATVHGDMHLRNILVRDGREPFFIDYAYSGPGHPCFDLARLESALLYHGLRMTADESKVATLLSRIADGCESEADLAAEFPQLMGSPVNRLVVRACIRCRAVALQLASRYGGGEDDYLAVRLILACQGLLMPNLQTGVVRASIVALAVRIGDRWSEQDAKQAGEADQSQSDAHELSPL